MACKQEGVAIHTNLYSQLKIHCNTVYLWEFAARGGNPATEAWEYTFSGSPTANGVSYTASINSGIDSVGWYIYNTANGGVSGEQEPVSGQVGCGSHEVGLKQPNALGIYDMSGNTLEWCYDLYETIVTGNVTNPVGAETGTKRICRGGNYYWSAYDCSVCNRKPREPHVKYANFGFRIVRSLQ